MTSGKNFNNGSATNPNISNHSGRKTMSEGWGSKTQGQGTLKHSAVHKPVPGKGGKGK